MTVYIIRFLMKIRWWQKAPAANKWTLRERLFFLSLKIFYIASTEASISAVNNRKSFDIICMMYFIISYIDISSYLLVSLSEIHVLLHFIYNIKKDADYKEPPYFCHHDCTLLILLPLFKLFSLKSISSCSKGHLNLTDLSS